MNVTIKIIEFVFNSYGYILNRMWSNSLNQLLEQNLAALRDVLYDPARPFCSHYGAIMGLIALGSKVTKAF